MQLSEFDSNTPYHSARLANWLLLTVGEGRNDPSPFSVMNLALWLTGHLTRRPTRQRDIPWQSLANFRYIVRLSGPPVSDDEITFAISQLPSPAQEKWDQWSA